MYSILRTASVCLFISACGHHHGAHYGPPPDYHHYHRLSCDHLVECHYRGGKHHYRRHRSHDSYWHVHRTDHGYYRCYVKQRHHRY